MPGPSNIDPSMISKSDQEKFGIGGEPITNDVIGVEAEEATELELTPEIEAMIMAKVQDIDEPNTAYHFIAEGRRGTMSQDEKLSSVLINGIMPTLTNDENQHPKSAKEARLLYLKALKEYKNKASEFIDGFGGVGSVYFNYVREDHWGESLDDTQISQDPWCRGPLAYGIVFDWSSLKYERYSTAEYRKLKYSGMSTYMDAHGTSPLRPHGFTHLIEGSETVLRIPPSKFRGICINLKGLDPEKHESVDEPYDQFVAKAQEVVKNMTEIYKDKPNYILPIYDVHGNLLWPRQMSYEEVKAFVTERDKKKTKNQPNSQEVREESLT
jgi:hypothetical protein